MSSSPIDAEGARISSTECPSTFNKRDNEQCRSHHQKMLKKYGTVQKIIAHFKKEEDKSVSSKEEEIALKNTSIMNVPPLQASNQ